MDAETVRDAVCATGALRYGAYDKVATLSAPNEQHFQPLDGAAAGAREPMTVVCRTLSFSVESEDALRQALEAAVAVHPYQEPVIYVSEQMASRADYAAMATGETRWWNKETKPDWA